MNQIYILDAGRADCIVLMLTTADRHSIVVIDGGTKQYRSKKVLVDFLLEQGIDRIDLLILTHLHQDHFGGFHNLINKVKVAKAVVPYGDIVFNEAVNTYYANDQYFREYHEIFDYFKQCNTEVIDICQNYGLVFEFGENTLRCIYPIVNDEMVIPGCIDKLCSDKLSIPEMKEYCDIFMEYCNKESSIWALENKNECIAIFAGDSITETMKTACMQYQKRPRMLKLSHHGMGTEYFDKEQLEIIRPKDVVICNSEEFFPAIRNDCENVCNSIGARIHYTFRATYKMVF